MHILDYKEALVVYDGLQVYLAQDQFSVNYICTLVEQNEHNDKFVCAPISPRRLYDLVHGGQDLASIYLNPESGDLFWIASEEGNLDRLEATRINPDQIPPRWLPKEGFFIRGEIEPNIEVVRQSVDRSRAILHCRLNPPEAATETKIYADHLSQATRIVQKLVKYAFRHAIRGIEKGLRDRLLPEENFQLEVFGFANGSFTVQMQAAVPADLVGYPEMAKALEVIDGIASLATSAPNETVTQVSLLGGHFATAYKDLLKFISDTETQFEYEWARPDKATSSKFAISSKQAKPIYDALVERVDIEIEQIQLVGKLNMVDEKRSTWRLRTDEGKEYFGESNIDLAGMIIVTQRYEIVCEEHLMEERGTGREFVKLHLKIIRKI